MKAATIRSGLVESTHEWSAVLFGNGAVERTWGAGQDRRLFARSTVKPLQATMSQSLGADLVPEHLAVACASHSATPAHVAIVAAMLSGAGLDQDSLQCPPHYPLGAGSRIRWIRAGHMQQRIAHNCSGKHAAFLRACVAQGWDPATYLAPDHPLQRAAIARIADATADDPYPTGVDGCGAPTARVTLTGLARGFAAISRNSEFADVATAMGRYPALSSDNERPDGRLAMWWPGPAKIGAEGLMVMSRDGWGLAVKSWEGSAQIAVVGAIEALHRCGLLEPHVVEALRPVASPPVLGGGRAVGRIVADVSRIDPADVKGSR